MKQRFSPRKLGAVYPLAHDELLQARAALNGPAGVSGRLLLRVTKDAWREQAAFWFHDLIEFNSSVDEMSNDDFKRLQSALLNLESSRKDHQREADANDSGRSLIFWHDEKMIDVFISNNSSVHRLTEAFSDAFESVWQIVTRPSEKS